MLRLLDTVAQVAPSEATVLISGESGTGKEVVAGALHVNSARREGPFVSLNCAAITESLMESELFGHEKGAFTGAERRRDGPLPAGRRGHAVPGRGERDAAVHAGQAAAGAAGAGVHARGRRRPCCAWTCGWSRRPTPHLSDRIAAGRFREDLYYRLNVVALRLPPLRERREDIPLLAQHFLEMFAAKNRTPVKGFSPQAMDRLIRSEWPGNVRELMNAVERAVVLARADYLTAEDFPAIGPGRRRRRAPGRGDARALALERGRAAIILDTLAAAGGNKSETARRLGITRRTLHKKLKAYGVMK